MENMTTDEITLPEVNINNFPTKKEVVDIEKIGPNPWNPNVMNEKTFEKEKDSIKALGMIGSILARRYNHTTYDYQIIDGEHRWKACKELGFTKIPVEIYIDEIADSTAKMLTIMMNTQRGEHDVLKEAQIFNELNSDQLSLLPQDEAYVENAKKLLVFDFTAFDEQRAEVARKSADSAVYLAISAEEKAVWTLACALAKDKEKKSERELFIGMLKFYLQLRAKDIPEYAEIKF